MDSVIRYYEDTWLDYRAMWTDNHSRAMHFGYFDGRARTHAEALANTNRVLAEFAHIQAGDHVLDAGCGVGGSSCWLAANLDVRCVGITPVQVQVRKARKLAAERGVKDRTRFVRGNYLCLPFAENEFDVVWALESLCHAADKSAFYREAARVLRPGGRLVIAEYMRSSRPLDQRAESMLRKWCEGWCMPDLDTREEHLHAAKLAGFDLVNLTDLTSVVDRSLRRLYRLARLAEPLDRLLHLTGMRNGFQHRNVIAARLQYEALRNGLWQYGVLCATKR